MIGEVHTLTVKRARERDVTNPTAIGAHQHRLVIRQRHRRRERDRVVRGRNVTGCLHQTRTVLQEYTGKTHVRTRGDVQQTGVGDR